MDIILLVTTLAVMTGIIVYEIMAPAIPETNKRQKKQKYSPWFTRRSNNSEKKESILINHIRLGELNTRRLYYPGSKLELRFCPNQNCGILIEKISGCNLLICFCGTSFDWRKAMQCVDNDFQPTKSKNSQRN